MGKIFACPSFSIDRQARSISNPGASLPGSEWRKTYVRQIYFCHRRFCRTGPFQESETRPQPCSRITSSTWVLTRSARGSAWASRASPSSRQEKAQFARYRAELLAVQTRAEALRYALLDVMDRDTEAFLQVSRAFPMPKSTEEEKATRSAAIQKGLELCTQTPLEIMKLAAEALDLAASLLGRFNENAASDLGVAVLSLQAGLRGANDS